MHLSLTTMTKENWQKNEEVVEVVNLAILQANKSADQESQILRGKVEDEESTTVERNDYDILLPEFDYHKEHISKLLKDYIFEDPMDEDKESEENLEEEEEQEQEQEDENLESLEGCVIAITGSLSKTRSQITTIIASNGGKYSASLSKKVTHLVTNDPHSDSTKTSKAKKMGIKIVGEDFLDKFK